MTSKFSVFLLLFICMMASAAQANVKNSLGNCVFQVTNKLIQEQPNHMVGIRTHQENSMMQISRTCKSNNKTERDLCQINHMIDAIAKLQNTNSKAYSVLIDNIEEQGPCAYLTLFKDALIEPSPNYEGPF